VNLGGLKQTGVIIHTLLTRQSVHRDLTHEFLLLAKSFIAFSDENLVQREENKIVIELILELIQFLK
jgi:hypothetical protein